MSKRVQVGGEEFEIENPRARRMKVSGAAQQLPADDEPIGSDPNIDGPPTQAERLEAIKAIHTAHNQVRNLYRHIGGKKGSRLTSIALNYLDTALAVMLMHTTTTPAPWR